MIIDAIKGPLFGTIVSFMLGVAIVMVVSPICHGSACMIIKAPPLHEVKNTVYHIGSKCYKFTPVGMDCPESGIVEAFENVPLKKGQAAPKKGSVIAAAPVSMQAVEMKEAPMKDAQMKKPMR
jgi:hypothetical protein